MLIAIQVVYGGRVWLNLLRGLSIIGAYAVGAGIVLTATFLLMAWFSAPV